MTDIIIGLHRPYPVPDAPFCDGYNDPKSAEDSADAFDDGWHVARQSEQFEYVTLPAEHRPFYAAAVAFWIAVGLILALHFTGVFA